MCAHLNKTGSIYYFRRPVPKDLTGHIKTKTGKPRTEWKISLRTKDREEAKRLILRHEARTNAIIDEARLTLAKSVEAPSAARRMPSSARLREWENRDREQYELSELADLEMAHREFEREELEPLMDAIKSGKVPNDCQPERLARAGYPFHGIAVFAWSIYHHGIYDPIGRGEVGLEARCSKQSESSRRSELQLLWLRAC